MSIKQFIHLHAFFHGRLVLLNIFLGDSESSAGTFRYLVFGEPKAHFLLLLFLTAYIFSVLERSISNQSKDNVKHQL